MASLGTFLELSVPINGQPNEDQLEPTVKKYFSFAQLNESKKLFLSLRFQKKVSKPFRTLFEKGLDNILLPKNTLGLWSFHWKKNLN